MKINMNYKIILFAVLLLLKGQLTNTLFAQSDGQHGTTMNLSYGTGARAMGLGRAYVAAVNDPSAVFWNPAGLNIVQRSTFTLFHNQIFEGTVYDFGGIAYPTLTYGTVGFGFARLGTSDIKVTSIDNILEGTSSYDELELYFSYANKLPFNLLGGATFKVRRQQFSGGFSRNATGFGLDFGLMYQPDWESSLLRNLKLGLSYRNFVSPVLKLGTEADQEPFHLTFGLVKGLVLNESGTFNVVMDFHKSRYEGLALRTGTEYQFRDMGKIRLGLDNGQMAFGAGITYNFVQLDYSFGSSLAGGEFPPTHRFSLTFEFGKSRQELIHIAEEKRIVRERNLVEAAKEEERRNFIAEKMKKGNEYLQAGQYFDAYVEYQQVISVDPFNERANALMDSTNEIIQRDLEQQQAQAISQAVDKELAEENRNFVKIHLDKGQLHLQNNQFTDALVEFNLAQERAPDDPTIQDAIATAERRLDEEVRNLVVQGRAEFQRGNYSSALQILSQALVLSPDDPDLQQEINTLANRIKLQNYIQEGLQFYDFGEYQRALNLFEEALKMDPSNQRLQQYIDRTKRGMGVAEKEMDTESEREYLRAVDSFLAGRYQEALDIWKELQKEYPYSKKIQTSIDRAEERIKRLRQSQ